MSMVGIYCCPAPIWTLPGLVGAGGKTLQEKLTAPGDRHAESAAGDHVVSMKKPLWSRPASRGEGLVPATCWISVLRMAASTSSARRSILWRATISLLAARSRTVTRPTTQQQQVSCVPIQVQPDRKQQSHTPIQLFQSGCMGDGQN